LSVGADALRGRQIASFSSALIDGATDSHSIDYGLTEGVLGTTRVRQTGQD
jgi:hypothetical protein